MPLKGWLIEQGLWEEFVAEGGTDTCQDVIDGFEFIGSVKGRDFWWHVQYTWERYEAWEDIRRRLDEAINARTPGDTERMQQQYDEHLKARPKWSI